MIRNIQHAQQVQARRHDDYPGDGASYLFVIVAMAMLIGALLS